MKFITLLFAIFLVMAPLEAKDWKAQWITSAQCQSRTNSWLCFQKTVDLPALDGNPVYADIAVDSKYWLWINGKMVVFEGGLKRGPNPRDTYYDHVDKSTHLYKFNQWGCGKNVLYGIAQDYSFRFVFQEDDRLELFNYDVFPDLSGLYRCLD